MSKAISLKILKLQYGGESIGNDILLEIEIAGEKFSSDQTIKRGATFEYNQEVKQFRGVENAIEVPLKIRVIEKDFLFNDVGETAGVILIDLNSLPKSFDFQVKVQERNKLTLGKSTAIFSITMEAKEFNPVYPRPQVYVSPNKKDYNRFDTEITNAVGEWNDEFFNQEYPPLIPLDPSLVKAMIYVESVIGYGKQKHYPSYPDVMQVADPANDAIYALKNIFNSNPGKKKMATEYEVFNQQLKTLKYKDANGNSPERSIHFGVRYLYHLAQKNIPEGNLWKREWYSWEEIFPQYNGGGDKKYKEKVLNIYTKGIAPEKNNLWSLSNALMILFAIGITFTSFVSLNFIDNLDMSSQSAGVVYGIPEEPIVNKQIDSESFTAEGKPKNPENADLYLPDWEAATLEWENYPATNCRAIKDDYQYAENLKNCDYTVGTEDSPMWTVKLKDGGYGFTPEGYHDYNDYDYKKVGPYSVTYRDSRIGDLDGDGTKDAVVILEISFEGSHNFLNIIFLVQNSEGRLDQIHNYMMGNSEEISGFNIYNQVLSVHMILMREEDAYCCPSLITTQRFKIISGDIPLIDERKKSAN
jgi:hypothetical protein